MIKSSAGFLPVASQFLILCSSYLKNDADTTYRFKFLLLTLFHLGSSPSAVVQL